MAAANGSIGPQNCRPHPAPFRLRPRLKVEKGDSLYAIETPEGYLLTPYDPAIEEQLKAGRDFMKEYRETFKALAK